MRFSSFIFDLGLPVQPVALTLRSPLPLEHDTVWDPLHGASRTPDRRPWPLRTRGALSWERNPLCGTRPSVPTHHPPGPRDLVVVHHVPPPTDHLPRCHAVNLFYDAFQPSHAWELTLLPPMGRGAAETAEAFAARVARHLCEPLGLVATSSSTRDKAAHLRLVKRVGKSAWLKQQRGAAPPNR